VRSTTKSGADAEAEYLGRSDSLIEIWAPIIAETSGDQRTSAGNQVHVWAEVDAADRVTVTLSDGSSAVDHPMTSVSATRWEATIPIESRWSGRMVSLVFEASRAESELSTLPIPSQPLVDTLLVEPEPRDYSRLPSRWYFAEGVTYPGFESYVLLHNPNDAAITVTLDMLFENDPAMSLDFAVDPKSRHTIHLNRLVENRAMALVLSERGGRGFAADRAVYTTKDGRWIGAHAATGASALRSEFLFAEGASSPSNGHGDHYQTFFLLANPGDTPVDAVVTYYPEPGDPVEDVVQIGARSRRTLEPALHHPGLTARGFATQVRTTNGGTLVAERAMWWRDSQWNPDVLVGGSASAGIIAASREWYFAEPGHNGQREFLLLLNPNNALATFEFGLQFTDRKSAEMQTIAPRSRRTIALPSDLAAAPHGVRFLSDLPLVAERSTYRDFELISPVEGDNSSGATTLATTWLFAEGACFADFDTSFTLANPGNEAAYLWLNFHPDGGAPIGRALVLEAGRTTTVSCSEVDGLLPSAFSTEVISSVPIMVERSIVFGENGEGGTTAAGIALDAISVPTSSIPAALRLGSTNDATPLLAIPTPTPTPTVTPIRPRQ
jgi:hypothetical protein